MRRWKEDLPKRVDDLRVGNFAAVVSICIAREAWKALLRIEPRTTSASSFLLTELRRPPPTPSSLATSIWQPNPSDPYCKLRSIANSPDQLIPTPPSPSTHLQSEYKCCTNQATQIHLRIMVLERKIWFRDHAASVALLVHCHRLCPSATFRRAGRSDPVYSEPSSRQRCLRTLLLTLSSHFHPPPPLPTAQNVDRCLKAIAVDDEPTARGLLVSIGC
ncbi:cytochrome c oxidase polypeptide IV, mitochondrial precursor [Pseudozyma hubeiensis SY62]|uniref:Cytochrome c oxidase polypeptide IV, mitochondrial n=1 Tax=Pseudozyma hubeiensis (strain SY62) TaxID=1305764 RepID=R9PF05_PSEHS|nr:cytochrome c oxidase polypeptide IV, mitochondrial precursor [Pseudozyma hubeiensis SY62]GAC96680.1 cytochrome c oxidase polypeptide IV, mitochondrial precursor [Pseudozyma hubeiensis SY62]